MFWLIIGCFVHPKFLHLSGAQPDQIEHHSDDLTSPAKSTRYADFVVEWTNDENRQTPCLASMWWHQQSQIDKGTQ